MPAPAQPSHPPIPPGSAATPGSGATPLGTHQAVPVNEPCSYVRVHLTSLHVTKAEDFSGLFGEPGNSAEWYLGFGVNDAYATFEQSVVDDSDHTWDWATYVPIGGMGVSYQISVGGSEQDFGSIDFLPYAYRTHSWADNWGIGSQELTATADDYAYTVYYEVTCATAVPTSVTTKEAMLTAAHAYAAPRTSVPLSEGQALTLYIRRLKRHGMNFRRFDGDLAIFEGASTVERAASLALRGRGSRQGDASGLG